MDTIVPGKLYRSNRHDAQRILGHGGEWRQLGILGSINTAGEINLKLDPLLPGLKIPVQEMGHTSARMFDAAVSFYKKFHPVLVNCNQGRNRSSATIAAILISMGHRPAEAIEMTNPRLPEDLEESLLKWTRRSILNAGEAIKRRHRQPVAERF